MSEDQMPELSEEDKKQIQEAIGFSPPVPEEKHNVHSFLNRVATSADTIKLGNLESEEIGQPSKTLRTYLEMALISNKLMDNDTLSEFYTAKAEIITSSSLSKNAKLINLAVIQKRIVEDETKEKKENKGWFKSKNKDNQGGNQI